MSSRLSTSCLLVLVGTAACRGDAPSDSAAVAHRAAPAVTPSAATQRDLARELDATERAEDPDGALGALRDRWLHRELTWTVLRQRALCASADACHVVPFPAPRPSGVSMQGWLPGLAFAPGEYAKLDAACGADAMCELTFTGELAVFEVSSEEPTRLGFTSVRVVSSRRAAAQQTGG